MIRNGLFASDANPAVIEHFEKHALASPGKIGEMCCNVCGNFSWQVPEGKHEQCRQRAHGRVFEEWKWLTTKKKFGW
jgi:hypothetical protein